jgi:uncharacterized membrane protein YfcA
VALVAFSVEAAIGFGATVLAAALGAQVVPLDVMLPAFVPVNMTLSLWLALRARGKVAWSVLLKEAAPPVALGAITGLFLAHVPARLMLQLVFAVIVVMMAALELGRLVSAPVDDAERPLAGWVRALLLFLGGVAHGLFGTGGPMIVYVLRRRIPDKSAFRATLAVIWLTLNVALIGNFALLGFYSTSTGFLAAAIAVGMIPALYIGSRLHHKLDPRSFQRAVCVLLLVAGALLAIRTGLQLRTPAAANGAASPATLR